ncbi:dienelactone hydrolase family protein, partial [Fulvivirga sp. RKSG066]|uniref:dienelactone hydrolase family protein n=1 Tax=Fulvivirga aurantia TaxID=2529383 RepID=UPI0012BCFE81
MKKLILSFLPMFFATLLMAQDNITICHTPATESFALFASNKDFNADHREPLPYIHQSEVGKMITYKTNNGPDANAYMLEAKVTTDSYLYVIHEWWGLNEHIKKQAEKLYDDLGGVVNVIALDLYDGKTADTREKASELMSSVKTDRAKAIVEGGLAMAGSGSDVATIGWCFGGGWSLQTAIMAGDALRGCVMYYGMPEKDVNRLEKLNGPVLAIFAEQDGWITPEVADQFKANMAEADQELTVKMYDAKHAFANPSNPDYNKEAADDAYKLALGFL